MAGEHQEHNVQELSNKLTKCAGIIPANRLLCCIDCIAVLQNRRGEDDDVVDNLYVSLCDKIPKNKNNRLKKAEGKVDKTVKYINKKYEQSTKILYHVYVVKGNNSKAFRDVLKTLEKIE
jgi:hypothetical protein